MWHTQCGIQSMSDSNRQSKIVDILISRHYVSFLPVQMNLYIIYLTVLMSFPNKFALLSVRERLKFWICFRLLAVFGALLMAPSTLRFLHCRVYLKKFTETPCIHATAWENSFYIHLGSNTHCWTTCGSQASCRIYCKHLGRSSHH